MRRRGSKKLLVRTIIGTSDRRGKHLPSSSLPSPHHRTEPSFPGDSQCSVRSSNRRKAHSNTTVQQLDVELPFFTRRTTARA